jgi:hypothetical protein
MYNNQLDYQAIQRRAEAEVRRSKSRAHLTLFLVNLFLFLVFMLIGWGTIGGRGLYPEQFFVSMLLLSICWFTGLILHGTSVWMVSAASGRRLRERAIAREIGREMTRLGLDQFDSPPWDEKAKRQIRLSEDGEYVQEFDDEPAFREQT